MKLSHMAAQKASRLVAREQEGKFDEVFVKYPELLEPAFWEFLMTHAEDPSSAQALVEDMNALLDHGAWISNRVMGHIVEVMAVARRTLRTEEIRRMTGGKQ